MTPKPEPPPVVELAKSLTRQYEDELVELHQREQDLIAQGLSQSEAVIQASREWLKRNA